MSIEQDRRDFMRDAPELYDYIFNRVASRVLKEAGDRISGYHEAANIVWYLSTQYKNKYQQKTNES